MGSFLEHRIARGRATWHGIARADNGAGPLVTCLMQIVTARRQTLHDTLAGVVVIEVELRNRRLAKVVIGFMIVKALLAGAVVLWWFDMLG